MRDRGTEEAWCVHNDPCGLCCVGFTYGLIFFADYGVPLLASRAHSQRHALAHARTQHSPAPPWLRSTAVVFALLLPWSGFSAHFFLHTFAFLTVSMLAVTSHMRTMLTDPGAVPVGYSPEHLLHEERGESLPMCSRCNGFKPPRAHHCSQCDRCVMKMDHHCPWVNNCVGANNQKHFVLFVGYTGLMCSYALLLLCLRTVNAVPAGGGPPTGQIGAAAPGPSPPPAPPPHTRAHARAAMQPHTPPHALAATATAARAMTLTTPTP